MSITRKMSSLLLVFLSFTFTATMTSCGEDTETIVNVDSSQPNGTFTASKSGTLTAQNGTPTEGTVEVGIDEDGSSFLRLGNDFMTGLGTGTVSIYFSTSDTFTPDPANGNPDLILVGVVTKNGETFYKLENQLPSNFTHLILWCGTANIPFGNAPLQ